ncbi:Equilibrative nucleotide transporter 3 [Camellia lanceoleosa]|uniref:Equilibrative nucleotide transporter 3 n=1 Tax=Camellia lanceoleosa TaxID=1840588 RepID=A0ACC0F359_9ERIC|nr:Equilibrative nucleotide transporter 3 [Camellia lanceoleosa]
MGVVDAYYQRRVSPIDWNLGFRRALLAWEEEEVSRLYDFLTIAPDTCFILPRGMGDCDVSGLADQIWQIWACSAGYLLYCDGVIQLLSITGFLQYGLGVLPHFCGSQWISCSVCSAVYFWSASLVFCSMGWVDLLVCLDQWSVWSALKGSVRLMEVFVTLDQSIAGALLWISLFGLLGSATLGKGDIGNYTGICIIVATLGVTDGHVQGGMVGDLSFMCPTFIQSFRAGLAALGALTSALRLMTKQPLKELIMAFAREPV